MFKCHPDIWTLSFLRLSNLTCPNRIFSPPASTPVPIQIQLSQWMGLFVISQVKKWALSSSQSTCPTLVLRRLHLYIVILSPKCMFCLPAHHTSPYYYHLLIRPPPVSQFVLREGQLASLIFLISIPLTATRVTTEETFSNHITSLPLKSFKSFSLGLE